MAAFCWLDNASSTKHRAPPQPCTYALNSALFPWLCWIAHWQTRLTRESCHLKSNTLKCLQTNFDFHDLSESDLCTCHTQTLQLAGNVQSNSLCRAFSLS